LGVRGLEYEADIAQTTLPGTLLLKKTVANSPGLTCGNVDIGLTTPGHLSDYMDVAFFTGFTGVHPSVLCRVSDITMVDDNTF
jgi:hypothetical protein